jgi:hypothetical protein
MDDVDIIVFIVWSLGLPQVPRIVADLRTKFELLDVRRVSWGRHFAANLRRLYGADLPERVDKATGSGSGPFHVYVVRDPDPAYELRPRSWGMHPANAKAYDAKQLYREWTGGGFRVHASNDAEEAERDLFLLLGRTRESFLGMPAVPWDTVPTETTDELVGAEGWSSDGQLIAALAINVRGVVESRNAHALTVRVDDVARARQIAGGRRVLVGREPVRLTFRGRGRRRVPRPTRAGAVRLLRLRAPSIARRLGRSRRRARLEIARLRATIRGFPSRRDGKSS